MDRKFPLNGNVSHIILKRSGFACKCQLLIFCLIIRENTAFNVVFFGMSFCLLQLLANNLKKRKSSKKPRKSITICNTVG